jgi:hypothetical protein
MDELRSTMTAVAEVTRAEAQGPGPEAAWRRGRRRRAAAASAGALLSVALVAAVFTLVRPQTAAVAPAGGGAAATTVPPSKAVACPAGKPKLVACGESQGVAWEAKLTDRFTNPSSVRLELRVAGGRDAGWYVMNLHSSGNADPGRPFTVPTAASSGRTWGCSRRAPAAHLTLV